MSMVTSERKGGAQHYQYQCFRYLSFNFNHFNVVLLAAISFSYTYERGKAGVKLLTYRSIRTKVPLRSQRDHGVTH